MRVEQRNGAKILRRAERHMKRDAPDRKVMVFPLRLKRLMAKDPDDDSPDSETEDEASDSDDDGKGKKGKKGKKKKKKKGKGNGLSKIGISG